MSTICSDERKPLKNTAKKSTRDEDDPAMKKVGYGVIISVAAIFSIVVVMAFMFPGAAGDTTSSLLLTTSQVSTSTSDVAGDTTSTSSLLRTTSQFSTGTSDVVAPNPSCSATPTCSNLEGDCCPASNGVFVACCHHDVTTNILIVYAGETITGPTATLAKWLGEGASSVQGTTVVVKTTTEATIDDLKNAAGIILGSGDWNGSPETGMFEFLGSYDPSLKPGDLDLVPFGVFATSHNYAGGVQDVLNSMARSLMTFGGIYVSSGRFTNSQGVAGLMNNVYEMKDGKPVRDKNGNKVQTGWKWHEANSTVDDSKNNQPKHGIMRHLKDDAKAYGKRIANLATFHSSFPKDV